MIEFEWPWVFLILPLPLLLRFFLPVAKQVQDASLSVPFLDDIQPQKKNYSGQTKFPWLLVLSIIAWLCLVLAATRPQWLNERVDIPISGRDLMLAVDLSGSMRNVDFVLDGTLTNRLQAVKHVAGEFIKKRKGDRLGLILFGRQPYLQTPLTFDINTVNTHLQESMIGIAGNSTAIGDAIVLATKRLREKQQDSRVLILLTDGENTAGEIEPLRAAQLAKSQQLKIYTIGIGANLIISSSAFRTRSQKNNAIDEKTLTAIADQTGGQYYRAHDIEELNKIYQVIDELEPIEQDTQSYRPLTALFYWPLSLAILLAFIVSLTRLIIKP
ncbi:MAG: VWA domain-containing protein [Gammaproteobacteria bacterium]|nr:VWA domain-containing protein [Gammaproteobacteria bacterium]